MLHHDNEKNLNMKETIFVSQDCPKLLGLPVACGSQRVNRSKIIQKYFYLCYFIQNFDEWKTVLRTRFDSVIGFIRVYDGTRYLVSFDFEKNDTIHNSIWYLLNQKSGITYDFSHNYERMKIDSYDVLPLAKTLFCIML